MKTLPWVGFYISPCSTGFKIVRVHDGVNIIIADALSAFATRDSAGMIFTSRTMSAVTNLELAR